MKRINIFTGFPEIEAYFTQKPDSADATRPALIEAYKNAGGRYIRPLLVHGTEIKVIDEAFIEDNKDTYIEIPETDGTVTDLHGIALTSTHGDCIPVYAYDPTLGAIGLAHAGWRGTAAGIAGKLIKTMTSVYGSDPESVCAYIGPGIGLCHFEVGSEVADQFKEAYSWSTDFINMKNDGKAMIDLKGINRRILELEGVKHIEISEDCTFCLKDKYYSYRRCEDTDRMLASIRIL